jgi:hypothetical protein
MEALKQWFNSIPADVCRPHWDELTAIVTRMLNEEREACAKVADAYGDTNWNAARVVSSSIARLIRDRIE